MYSDLLYLHTILNIIAESIFLFDMYCIICIDKIITSKNEYVSRVLLKYSLEIYHNYFTPHKDEHVDKSYSLI